MLKSNYDIIRYNFKEKLEKLFAISDLSILNEVHPIFKRETDQSSSFHRVFYEWARSEEFTMLYESFISNEVQKLYSEEIVYQAIPTFRIAFPGNIAVGEYHKDRFYRDENWAKQVREHNFFLPFTDAFDTNTIWVESEEDKGDYAPMDCKYGEFIQWDGSNLTHGNKLNVTGKTRVSIDFRVILGSNYIPSEGGSINTKTPFAKGGYYK